jgi:hypothetical protein
MRLVSLAAPVSAVLLCASAALAGTPAFQHTFDNDNFPGNRVPQHFQAELGEIYVLSSTPTHIAPDPTCDSLSTQVLQADLPTLDSGDVRVLFVHQDGDADHVHGIGEQEVMSLKVGQQRTDVFGIKVGFESVGVNGGPGYQVFPVQLGPAVAGDTEPEYGRIYVNGEATTLRYGNVEDSVCSGAGQVNFQVNVALKLYGLDHIYYVEVTSFGPRPQRQTFGPFDLPPAFDNGYGACHVYAPAGSGTVVVDGVECIANAPVTIDPINDGSRNHRIPVRRSR